MLVGYPIVAATDVHVYLRTLERAIVAALGEEGIDAHQRESTPQENLTGVWVGGTRKIASLGVHMSRGVAAHGFAIGADNDLTPWSWFTPCGLPTAQMTSVGAETGRADTLPCLRKRAANHVARALGLRQRLISRDRLERTVGYAHPVASGRPTAP
jgi:lipoate-protein ligase B